MEKVYVRQFRDFGLGGMRYHKAVASTRFRNGRKPQGAAICNRRFSRSAVSNRRSLMLADVRRSRQDWAVGEVQITPVQSRAERDAFIKFPWRIYANDPAWVPPLLVE